jgi:hypothetical protein
MRGHGRTFLALLLASAALVVAILAPASQAQLPTCPPGTTNTLYCQVGPPVLSAKALSAACRASAARVHIPATTITSVAGLRSVTVKLDGHTIKTVKISVKNSFTLKNLSVSAKGLKPGLHTVTVTAVDTAGRTARRVFHFAICKPKPKFTG